MPDLSFGSPGERNVEENYEDDDQEYNTEDGEVISLQIGDVLKICQINVEGLTKD